MSRTFAWLTPAAPAAIAVVQLTADEFPVGLIDRKLPTLKRARFALLLDSAGQMVDEVVVVRSQEQQLELQCHGGVGIRAAIEAALESHDFEAGAIQSDEPWSAFARLQHTAAIPLLSAALERGDESFPELWFRQPVILLTGPANAGKSTLLNAWCGHRRAIVSEQAGTTRDLLVAVTEIQGWQVQLIDSAGLRQHADGLERAGQALVEEARQWVDLVIFVDPGNDDTYQAEPGDLLLHSKADLIADASTKALVWSAQEFSSAQTSAQQLRALEAAVLERLALARCLPTEDDK